MLSYVAMHSKQRKTTKVIKLQWLASIWCQNDWKQLKTTNSDQITMNLHRFDVKSIKNVELRRNAFKTTQNYKSNQITMTCIDLMSKHSKLQKWSKYKDLHRFHVKTIKTTQNYKSDQITMYCIELTSKRSKMLRFVAKHSKESKLQKYQITMNLHRFDVKTIKNVELRRKTFKTTQNYKSDQIQLLSIKKIKNVALSRKTSKQRKTTKVIKLQWIASIWRHNDKKCWVTSQCIQNNAKLQKWSYNDEFASISCQNDQNNSKLQKRSNYNELHRFDVITIKMLSYVAMHSKQHKTTKVIKLQWLASIWCQNIENNPKLK